MPNAVHKSLVVPHLLERGDRKVSAPVLGAMEAEASDTHELARTEEIENIPETVEEDEENVSFSVHAHHHHHQHHPVQQPAG